MTTFTVTLDGVDYSPRMINAVLSPQSLINGQSSAILHLNNHDSGLNGNEDLNPNKVAIVQVNGVTFFTGYLDKVMHFYGERTRQEFGLLQVTRILCRDYSQDLANKRITKSYPQYTSPGTGANPLNTTGEILDNMLEEVVGGSPRTEITYDNSSDWTSDMKGLELRDEPILNVIRELCERQNADAYVDASKALHFFPNQTTGGKAPESSGITLVTNDIIDATHIEKDGLDIKNNIDLYGEKTVHQPDSTYDHDYDDYTEPDEETDLADYETNSLVYVSPWNYVCVASAAAFAQPFKLKFDYTIEGASNGSVKATYTIEGQAEQSPAAWESAGIMPGSATITLNNMADTVAGATGYAIDKDVTIKIYYKLDAQTNGDHIHVTNIYFYHKETDAYWDSNLVANFSMGISDTRVKNNYSIYTERVASILANFNLYLNTPINCKYPEHDFSRFKFTYYADLTTGGSRLYVEVHLLDSLGNRLMRRITLHEDEWIDVSLPLGCTEPLETGIVVGPTYGWEVNGLGFDWESIATVWIHFYNASVGSDTYRIYLDKVYFDEKPQHDNANDSPYTNYKKRDYAENMPNSAYDELVKRADSLLEKMKVPLEAMALTVDGTKGIVAGANKWLPGNTLTLTVAPFGVSAATWRMVDIVGLECKPRQPIEAGHDFIATVLCVPQATKVESQLLRQATRPDWTSFVEVR